jgi:anti-sigma regulatory factor (Ser/Thr protein kinase)
MTGVARCETFGPEFAQVSDARAFVRSACEGAGLCEDAVETAVLLTSEVVTNAFIHGRSEARLRVESDRVRARVQVADDNSRRPQPQPEDADALDGRGLQIVGLAANDWGVAEDDRGKVVWFDVVCP